MIILLLTLMLSATSVPAQEQQQQFLLTPRDSRVVVGQKAELECQVANRVGVVQWSKDGFLLGRKLRCRSTLSGFDPAIPGYPRYNMKISEENGFYNLVITDVRLEDEGDYQCQVGPAPEQQPIRATAQLTVMLPPSHVLINKQSAEAEVQVREGTRVVLICESSPSKPQTELRWFRNDDEITQDSEKAKSVSSGGSCRLCHVSASKLTLHPKREDIAAVYRCEAAHPALQGPLVAYLKVRVLYPPDPPEIEGYNEDDSVEIGRSMTLVCVARTGNPPARLVWFRDNVQVDVSFTTSGMETKNSYTFTVRPTDNKASYRCEASNDMSSHPSETAVRLNVIYPPSKVTISGPTSATSGDTVTFTCITSPSNPPALVTWVVDNSSLLPGEELSYGTDIGWVTTSNLTVTLTRQEPEMKSFMCKAETPPLKNAAKDTAKMAVFYPPGSPTILGYTPGTVLKEGDLNRFVCVALGGNPRAKLRWFRGDREISTITSVSGSGVASELFIQAKPQDNGAVYRCEAENIATVRPFAALIQLFVYFSPYNVSVSVHPESVKAGSTVTLTCTASSSNPESRITWLKNGLTMANQREDIASAAYGGFTTRSRLTLRVTSKDDGSIFTCAAKNEALDRTVKDNVTLRVVYKPEFPSQMMQVDVVEGETTIANVTAKANPSDVQYTWKRQGIVVPTARDRKRLADGPRVMTTVEAEGPVLYMTKISRIESGAYTLEASNTEGLANASVLLNVLYSATVVNLTSAVEGIEGEDVHLECHVDANPSSPELIHWRRKDSSERLNPASNSAGHSEFILKNVRKEDAGTYECVAFNGLGKATVKGSYVTVMFKPTVVHSMTPKQVGGAVGQDVSINCIADGSPNVNFVWSFNGTTIDSALSRGKYVIRNMRTEANLWESVLHLRGLEMLDYGKYTCLTRNQLGYDFYDIQLVQKSLPHVPINLRVLNVTDNAVILSWQPGFDGGSKQTFRIRYNRVGEIHYVYEEVSNGKSECQVSNLDASTEYAFSIAAANDLGESAFTDDIVKATTKSASVSETKKNKNEKSQGGQKHYWWFTTAIVGGILVFLNASVVIFLICRKRRRRKAKKAARKIAFTSRENVLKDEKRVRNVDGAAYLLEGSQAATGRLAENQEEVEMNEVRHHWERCSDCTTFQVQGEQIVDDKQGEAAILEEEDGTPWPDILTGKWLGHAVEQKTDAILSEHFLQLLSHGRIDEPRLEPVMEESSKSDVIVA